MKKLIFGVLALFGVMAHGCGMVAAETLAEPVFVEDVTVTVHPAANDVVCLASMDACVTLADVSCVTFSGETVCSAILNDSDATVIKRPEPLPETALEPMEQVCPFPQWPEHCEVVVTRSGFG